jgi:hypothetical protein
VVAELNNGGSAALFDNELITIIMCLAKEIRLKYEDTPMLYKPSPESPDSPHGKG